MEQVLSNFEVNGQPYYLLSQHDLNDKRISLTLTDGSSAWKGEITQDDMKNLAEVVNNMSVDDFTEQTLSALMQHERNTLKFQFEVKDSNEDRIFSWKKVMSSAGIKYQLGSLKLKEVENSSTAMQEIFMFSINKMKKLKENIRGLEKENERLSRERRKAVELLEECTKAKNELENDLYSKFVAIVNDKKDKIRQLQEELNAMNEGEVKKSNESNRMQSDDSDHQGEEEQEMDTDDELTNVEVKEEPIYIKVESLEENDSLLLDDGEVVTSFSSTSTRRRIRKPATKKPSEVKSAILPKTSSQTTPTRSLSKTPQLKRKGSSRSNQSDVDADDLFNEL